AGGSSNAFPELVDGAHKGARFDLSKVPLEESGLAPKEIWCNESQERYVMAVDPAALPVFQAMCERERCPFAVVGVATEEKRLILGGVPPNSVRTEAVLRQAQDDRDAFTPVRTEPVEVPAQRDGLAIDMPMDVLLGKPPKMHREVQRVARDFASLDLTDVALST